MSKLIELQAYLQRESHRRTHIKSATQANVAALASAVAHAQAFTQQATTHPGQQAQQADVPWSFQQLRGRLTEYTAAQAGAELTTITRTILEAQFAEEPVAWVMTTSETQLQLEDLMANGVDVGAIVFVKVPDVLAAMRAMATLLRSGAFGLVVFDAQPCGHRSDIVPWRDGDGEAPRRPQVPGAAATAKTTARRTATLANIPLSLPARLIALAREHHAALVFLTHSPASDSTWSSQVSLRLQTARTPHHALELTPVKDKHNMHGHTQRYTIAAQLPAAIDR